MKKIIVTAAICIAAIFTLTACGKPQVLARCSECYQEKMCREYSVTMLGTTSQLTICDDCIDGARQLAKLLGGTIK